MNETDALDNPSVECLVAEVTDDFMERLDRGEQPDIEEYAARYPRIAAVLRQVLPALKAVRSPARGSAATSATTVVEQHQMGCLGDYRLVREIGRGGMGVVYEAEQISLGRRVALKVLPFAAAMDGKQLQRFKNEAQAAGQLQHQNIVPVYGVGCERGVHYYAMQFVEGHALATVIHELRQLRRRPAPSPVSQPPGDGKLVRSAAAGDLGSLASEMASGRWGPSSFRDADLQRTTDFLASPAPATSRESASPTHPIQAGTALSTEGRGTSYFRTVAHLGVQAAEALEHAHQLGVVHRDIKPANLMVDVRGNLWVTDFGLAHCQSQAGLTMTGDLVGTLRYMSPEQALAKRVVVDHRTDIYSLGATMYELMTLQPAYGGNDRQDLLRQIAFEEPRLPRRFDKAIPAELETIVLKAMAKNPADRYVTAQAMADDLGRFLENKPIHARRPGLGKRVILWTRRRPALAGLLVVSSIAALALIGIVVGAFYNLELRKAKEQTQISLQEAETARQGEEKARKTAERFQYSQHIALAQVAWQDSNMSRLEELLDTCSPDYQHTWEWHYLKRQCRPNALTLTGHNGGVYGVAFSPDGKRIATGGIEGTVKLWDAISGQLLLTFPGPATEVIRVTFSPDGKRVAAANGIDRIVNIWEIATRQVVLSLTGHTSDVSAVAFSPDGKQIASASSDKTIILWDATTGRKLFSLLGHAADVLGLAFSPDGKRIASAGYDNTVKVWDLAARREALPPLRHAGFVNSVTFSPDGTLLASGGADQMLWIWEATSGNMLRKLEGHNNILWSVAFSPDGKRIASAGADRTIKVWDTATGRAGAGNPLLATLKGHGNVVLDVAYSPDGIRLASGSQDRSVKLWDGITSQEARTLEGHRGEVFSVAMSADGKRIASAAADGRVSVWDVARGLIIFSCEGHQDGVFGVTFSADGKWIVSGGADQLVKVWNAATGQVVHTLRGHNREVRCVAFTPDAKEIASGDAGGFLKLWEAATGKLLSSHQAHKGEVRSIAYDPDGSRLACAGADWAVRVWDAKLSQLIQLKGHHCWCHGVTFSRDEPASSGHGRRIASASGDGSAKIWDAETGKEIYTIPAHGGFVRGVAFGPDGTRLATAGADGILRLWDTSSGEEVLTLRGHGSGVSCVTFSPDGHQLVSGDVDGRIKIWDARPWTMK